MDEEWMWKVVSVSLPITESEPRIGASAPNVVVGADLLLNHNHPDLQAVGRVEMVEMLMGVGPKAQEAFRLRKERDQLREALEHVMHVHKEELAPNAYLMASTALDETREGRA